jgi:sulfide:quinone oxidoreductase
VKHLLAEMARRGIAPTWATSCKRFEADKVVTEGGEFAADLILFMPGMTGNAWFDETSCRARRAACCRPMRSAASGHEHLCGRRLGQLPRPRLDAQAGPHGRPAGRGAAANLLDDLAGRPRKANARSRSS